MQLLTDFIQPGNVYFRNKVYGPNEVLAGINSVAQYLGDNLVSKSPFIYLFATNHVKTVCAYFGIIKAHKICVLMDPKIGRLELAEKLLDTPPAACIRIISETESFDFSKEIEIREQPWKDGEEDLSDVCTMIYTAADDGYAKAAMLTHENLLADARAIVNGNNITSQSVSCAFLPFSHLYGFQVGLFVPNISGSSTIIQDELEFIKHSFLSEFPFWECITHLYSIPIIYLLISKVECLQNKLSKINCINSGGYSLSNEIREKFYKKLCIDIREGYGLSEASPVCILNSVNEPFKPGSIGRAINCCNVKIVDENNQNVKVNQIGEIVVSGYNIMKGYYNNQKITKRTIIDNWLFSGDLGRIDNEGYFYFIGTKKKMINYIGQKINPAEVKRLIKLQGNVRDIHIYGSNDPLFGQKAFANIQLFKNSNNEQEKLIKWCHENISIYKIPSKITFN